MTDLEKELQDALAQVKTALAAVSDMNALEECRVRFLGRKGLMPALMAQLGKVPQDQKPAVGKTVTLISHLRRQHETFAIIPFRTLQYQRMRRIGGKNAVCQRKGFSNGFGRGIAADEVRKTPSRKNIRTRQ